jgi:WD40 repeat protein
MKAFLRLRLWISPLLGITAGLLVAMLPPLPNGTLALQLPQVAEKHANAQVLGVSGDGRYVIIRQGQSPMSNSPIFYIEDESIALWDRQRETATPLISPDQSAYCTPLLAPDASVFCVIKGVGQKSVETPEGKTEIVQVPRAVTLYELPTGRVLKEFESLAQDFFFAPDGKLLAIENCVVREAETGREVHRLPAKIDEYEFKHTLGTHAVYATRKWKPGVRVYSCLTGEQECSATLPYSDFVTQICRDGRVLCWVQPTWDNIGLRDRHPSKIVDASSGLSRDFNESGYDQFAVASPDGEDFAFIDVVPPPPKWLRWLPIRQGGKCIRIVRWKTQDELAVLPGVKEVCFSADGRQLAALRADNAIEFYDYPLRKPWGLIIGVTLCASGLTWSVGWLWSRRRAKPQGGAA